MALTPRVAEALKLGTGDPIVAIHGRAVLDTFVGEDYQIRLLDEALWYELHAAGFERIVFGRAGQQVYFRDLASLRALYGREPAPEPPDEHMWRLQGPMGSLTVHQTSAAVRGAAAAVAASAAARSSPAAAPPSVRAREPMSDAFAVKTLAGLMRDDSVRTAVVIQNAEDFFRFVGRNPGVARDVAETFAELIAAGGRSDNLCVLTFTSDSWEGVLAAAEDINPLSQYLRRHGEQRVARGVERMGYPDRAEIERLVQLMRVRHGLRWESWAGLDAAVAAMEAQHEVMASTWRRRLKALEREPLTTAILRERGLIDAIPGGRHAAERLDALIGLGGVKQHVRRMVSLGAARAAQLARGRQVDAPALHLAFTGNPGTGKTTVAELVGELYREAGLLRRGHVHPGPGERLQLVGEYVGHSKPLVERAIDRALDGVLFIDEAYQLVNPGTRAFGEEAITTLLDGMEKLRDRLVVVIAGYPEQIEELIASNPGLPRRFPEFNRINFPDYAPDELFTILMAMIAAHGMALEPGLEPRLRQIVGAIHAAGAGRFGFGNAGEMRNLLEAMEATWALRIGAVDPDQPLAAEDIPEHYLRLLTERDGGHTLERPSRHRRPSLPGVP